jgi:fructose/tagatose bisphosphate aldolase
MSVVHAAPQAADSGFSSVMFDASMLDYVANIAVTDEAARWAHQRGLLLEAELGHIGGRLDQRLAPMRPVPERIMRSARPIIRPTIAMASPA